MLKTLRPEDFEEKEQHDGNELRAEVHHDYNEGHMADKASHTHKAVPHKKKAAPKRKSAAKKSPSPAPKSRSPSPAPKRKSSPSPKSRSPSPAPAPEPQAQEKVEEEEIEEEDAEQAEKTGAWMMLDWILSLVVLAVVTYFGASQHAASCICRLGPCLDAFYPQCPGPPEHSCPWRLHAGARSLREHLNALGGTADSPPASEDP